MVHKRLHKGIDLIAKKERFIVEVDFYVHGAKIGIEDGLPTADGGGVLG